MFTVIYYCYWNNNNNNHNNKQQQDHCSGARARRGRGVRHGERATGSHEGQQDVSIETRV